MDEGDGDWLDDMRTTDDLQPSRLCQAQEQAGAALRRGDVDALRRVLAENPDLIGGFQNCEWLLN
jgi:hypothetical protein